MVVINRSSVDKAQFGCIYGNGDGLKSPCSHTPRNRPMSPIHFEEGHSLRKEHTTKTNAGPFTWMLRIATIGVFYFLFKTYSELEARKAELSKMHNDFNELNEHLFETELELKSSTSSFVEMKKKLDGLTLQKGSLNKSLDSGGSPELSDRERSKLASSIVSRQEALTERVLDLQQVIKFTHMKDAVKLFGNEPTFFVEFEVEIEGRRQFFSVETAPITLMPHAVFTFLLTVHNGLWDDTIFLHRSNHIVEAAPQDSKGNRKDKLFEPENQLAFPEYSPEYAHEKYTLGFSGRPGGPAFYINTFDNKHDHGPGGQTHHTLSEEADPCFAKVFRGFNVVDDLDAMNKRASANPLDDGIMASIIKSARIITPKGMEKK